MRGQRAAGVKRLPPARSQCLLRRHVELRESGASADVRRQAGVLEFAPSGVPRGLPAARWRSGYAAACKAVNTGSIPVRASMTSL
jgi:hypothetical protein